MDVKVEIRGLRELASAFKAVDAGLPRQLRTEYLGVARVVADRIAGRVSRGSSGRAAGSIKPRASQRGASIAAGGSAAEYYPWLDFGGSVGKGHRPGVPWSGSIRRDAPDGGRYIYPTIAGSGDEIREGTEAAIKRAAEAAGFETKEGL